MIVVGDAVGLTVANHHTSDTRSINHKITATIGFIPKFEVVGRTRIDLSSGSQIIERVARAEVNVVLNWQMDVIEERRERESKSVRVKAEVDLRITTIAYHELIDGDVLSQSGGDDWNPVIARARIAPNGVDKVRGARRGDRTKVLAIKVDSVVGHAAAARLEEDGIGNGGNSENQWATDAGRCVGITSDLHPAVCSTGAADLRVGVERTTGNLNQYDVVTGIKSVALYSRLIIVVSSSVIDSGCYRSSSGDRVDDGASAQER